MAFAEPGKLPLDALGRPLRKVYVGRIAKIKDLNFCGESDNLILPDPEKPPSEKVSLVDIYPEKYTGSAGLTSAQKQQALAREKMVEYFPERVVQTYLGSESDELMYGGEYGGQDGAREVPLLNPDAYMGGAGLTSKEFAHRVRRDPIEEKLENPQSKPAVPYVTTTADRVVYGRDVGGDGRVSVKAIHELPTHGIHGAATYGSAAGLTSKEMHDVGHDPLELVLDKKVEVKRPPYLGSTADEVLYNRSIAKGETEHNEIKDLRPMLFRGAAGLTSLQEYKANQEDLLLPEHNPEEHKLGQARWGGEGEETIYGRSNENTSVEYEVQKLAPKAYGGAAGMTSKNIFMNNSAEHMVFKVNGTASASSLGTEAKTAIYNDDARIKKDDEPETIFRHLQPVPQGVLPRRRRHVARPLPERARGGAAPPLLRKPEEPRGGQGGARLRRLAQDCRRRGRPHVGQDGQGVDAQAQRPRR